MSRVEEGVHTSPYVRATGRVGLLSLYDPVIALTTREGRWRPLAVELARRSLPDGGTVLDLGAGTGRSTFAFREGGFDVIALDGDPEALDIARSRPGAEGVDWREGFSTDLDLDDGSVDAVNISLLLHHLDDDAKRRTLGEAGRVLRPGGVLIVSDWGVPTTFMKPFFRVLQLLDGRENTAAHGRGEIPGMIAGAGFTSVTSEGRYPTAWGLLEVIRATRP
jgi:SAM-dependent methyltransferase